MASWRGFYIFSGFHDQLRLAVIAAELRSYRIPPAHVTDKNVRATTFPDLRFPSSQDRSSSHAIYIRQARTKLFLFRYLPSYIWKWVDTSSRRISGSGKPAEPAMPWMESRFMVSKTFSGLSSWDGRERRNSPHKQALRRTHSNCVTTSI